MTGWESFLQTMSKFSDIMLAFWCGIFLCTMSHTTFVHSMFFHYCHSNKTSSVDSCGLLP